MPVSRLISKARLARRASVPLFRSILLAFLAAVIAACSSDMPQDHDQAREASQAEETASEEVAMVDVQPGAAEPAAEDSNDADYAALIMSAINHPDRPDADRSRDAQRKPDQIIPLISVQPGMKVFDLFTGGGYYAELMARITGPEGEVWAQNPSPFYERFTDAAITERLADNRLPTVTRHDHEMMALNLPDDYFDAITAGMIFHDLFWLTDDVPAVLSQIYAAMKPDGVFLITDHAAPEGTRAEMAIDFQGKHRIEEDYVVAVMERAGFELVTRSDLLRVPEDDRTKAFFEPEMQGKLTDRFVLVFRKPE